VNDVTNMFGHVDAKNRALVVSLNKHTNRNVILSCICSMITVCLQLTLYIMNNDNQIFMRMSMTMFTEMSCDDIPITCV